MATICHVINLLKNRPRLKIVSIFTLNTNTADYLPAQLGPVQFKFTQRGI